MKRLMILAALVLSAAGVFAADQDGAGEAKKIPEQQEVKKETGRQEITGESKPPEWPRPYKPTEEISADSVVPFPADI
jgi:hypothetical protein